MTFRQIIQPFLHWLNTLSLQSRLIGTYIIVILLPTTAVSLYFYNQVNETYIEDTRLKSIDALQNEKQVLLTQIETMERAAQLSLSDKEVIQYLADNESAPTSELIEFNNSFYTNLAQIEINNPTILHLRLYSASEYTYEIWPIVFQEKRVWDQPWYKLARMLGDREGWYVQEQDLSRSYDRTIVPELDPPKISLLREIQLPKGHHAGIVQVDMLLANFAPRTYGELQEDESQMLLLNAGGGYIPAAQDKAYAASLQQWLKENQADTSDASYQAEHQSIDNDTTDSNVSSIRYTDQGIAYLATSTRVDRLGAQLVHIVSLEKVLQDTRRARNGIVLLNIGFILLVSLITYFANTIILKNLRRLTAAMKKVRRGELHHGVQVDGGGEIGELAYHFNRMTLTINELIAQAVSKQALMKEAELRTLYSQIDAHFLYNTLENIKMLAEIEDQRQISDALTSLGGMMRYNFKWSGEYVKLSEEIRHIHNYIDVMNIRFEELVQLQIDIPAQLLELEILKMSLQPLVENAFKHAWNEDEYVDRCLMIQVIAEPDRVITVTVQDNGSGMSPSQLEALQQWIHIPDEPHHAHISNSYPVHASEEQQSRKGGIGLRNVQRRLALFYGEGYGLHITSTLGEGTIVTLRFPKVLLTGGE